jgi:uncharacterized protein (TIGR03437 family)
MLKSYVLALVGAAVLSGPCWGADFLTGQAARAVIGQPFFGAQNSGNTGVATGPPGGPRRPRRPASLQGTPITLLGASSGIAYVNNTLFVSDDNWLGLIPDNNRVLIYNGVQQMVPAFNAEIPPNDGRCPVCGGTASVVVGQPGFGSVASTPVTQASMFHPTAVASDGTTLAVADTGNNRVLIWKSIPTTSGQPADIVLGQKDFTSIALVSVTASAMRGPQGVWIQGGKLYVADTQNNRILIWNSIPTQNNQPADLVLGQPDFTTSPPVNQVNLTLTASANTMLSPTSVTSDGTRLYVSDLGFNRVLIWNTIPTTNQQPADVELGQLNMTNSVANDVTNVCASNGTTSTGTPTYPALCGKTLSFPRYALSNGTSLFVADGGNDRVLVFKTIPTQNDPKADVILGEPDEFSDVFSNTIPLTVSAADVTPTPTSLAWDGQNLYVADPTNFRILMFSPAVPNVPLNSVVNDASRAVFAESSVVVSGTITANNTATILINGTSYTYTVKSGDTLESVAIGLTKLINFGAGDPNVFATEEAGFSTVLLIARQPGLAGNNITLGTSISSGAVIVLTASSVSLLGGGDASIIAPGSVVLLRVPNPTLSDTTASAAPDGVNFPANLPFVLGGVELYFDGIRAPLFSVSPTEIRAQFPFLVTGANSVTSWVRTTHADGSVTVTDAINIPVEEQNPGIYADPTPGAAEPRAVIAYHGSSYATGTVTLGGDPQPGDTGTITIGGKAYTYTVVSGDTLNTIENQFITQINADPNATVTASRAGVGTAVRLQAKVAGAAGNGITLTSANTTLSTNTTGAQVAVSATNSVLCCANTAGALITPANPAIPGETITFYATGLGLVCASPVVHSVDAQGDTVGFCSQLPDPALSAIVDGAQYQGPAANGAIGQLFGTVGSISSTVIGAALVVGQIGLYQVTLEISSAVTPNPLTQISIEAGEVSAGNLVGNTSNLVVVPVAAAP